MRKAVLLLILGLAAWVGATAAPIHDAARTGEVPRLQDLLDRDPGLLNLKDENGRTPLLLACGAGKEDVVVFLLARGADVRLSDDRGHTPLHAASAVDEVASARVLMEEGADSNARDLDGKAPLNLAAANGALATVQLLIERKADLENRDSRGRTPLLTAARERGGVAVVGALLNAGASINAVDGGGDSALQLAAWRGYADVVDLLLERGAEVPVAGPGGQQLLAFAVSKGLDRLFVAMVRKGADLAIERDGSTLLHAGASGGSVRILQVLVEKGQNVNAVDANGWTPLMFAADMGRTEAVSHLLSKGAEANARNRMGQSAWNIASEHGDKEIADLLSAKGAETLPPKFPLLMGSYLGQKPPGKTPERFARGIVSGRYNLHSCIAFSPDGKEAMWSYSQPPRGSGYGSGRTLVTRLEGGRWTYPRPAIFGGVEVDDVPAFSPRGEKLYDMAGRPLPGGPEAGDENVWVWERSGSEWTRPQPVPGAVNEVPLHWQFGVDERENVYVSTNVAGGRGKGDLYVSRYDKGRYGNPVSLGDGVNTPADEATPFVTPDGRTLLFNRDLDLYASFLGKDGKWSEAVKLDGGVNTPAYELCPLLSPDGKYLFFMRGWSVYWVDAAVVHEAKGRSARR
ncbi:MAG: ankyrin repeat domain-containing protein [Acidobacteriota bacterium]